MSLQEQQNFLAKLYTDAPLRAAFSSEPAKIGTENNLTESEIAEISVMLPEEISFFAESLYRKRLREVEKLLPLTHKLMGDNFHRVFRQYSQLYNPQTIKKHLEDAIEFCGFLGKSDSVSGISKNTAKYERAKLRFYVTGKHLVVCVLSYDVREISRQSANKTNINLKRKIKIAGWFRFGKRDKHFFI